MLYNQLSPKAKAYCLRMQKRFNFPKLSDVQIIEKIGDWKFKKDGSLDVGIN